LKTLRSRATIGDEVKDGRIAARREYYDSADLSRQLGVDVRHVIEQ